MDSESIITARGALKLGVLGGMRLYTVSVALAIDLNEIWFSVLHALHGSPCQIRSNLGGGDIVT